MLDNLSNTDLPSSPAQYTAEWFAEQIERLGNVKRPEAVTAERDSILRRLGYPSYENYLTRALWKRIRERIRARDRNVCRRCDATEAPRAYGPRHEVHHDAYTEEVLKGEDDSLLFLLCPSCHREVEFDKTGLRRSDAEKRKVLRDRAGVQLRKEQIEQAKAACGGRCFWCKGNTEAPIWGCQGQIHIVPTEQGEEMDVWMCSVCISTLNIDKNGHVRSDEEQLSLLRKKANLRYNRRKPSTSFTFNDGFWRLNAMQRELLMNDDRRNCDAIHQRKKK